MFKLRHFAVVSGILLAAWSAHGQEVTAAINGIVTDPSGGAIIGMKITAKDCDAAPPIHRQPIALGATTSRA